MKHFTKTMVVTALLASAGAANAALVENMLSTDGSNELFLTVYNPNAVNSDSTLGLTYNRDLNITYSQLKSNGAAALSTFTGAGASLASDSNWTSFANTITNASDVKYVLGVGDRGTHGVFLTGNAPIQALNDPTVLLDGLGDRISQHGAEIAVGLGDNTSDLIKDIPETPFTGQFNHLGLLANESWAGWPHDATGTYGNVLNLYQGGFHIGPFDDGFGVVDRELFANSDVTKLGQFTLAGNTLAFGPAVTAVPLPAAAWLFGAGLVSMLRVARRKSVAA
jgi:hypothetical protein